MNLEEFYKNKNGPLYKHQNCTDIAIEIKQIANTTEGVTIDCMWWNIVSIHNIYMIGKDTIKIKSEDLKYWKKLNDY